jgi:hypothetical protein
MLQLRSLNSLLTVFCLAGTVNVNIIHSALLCSSAYYKQCMNTVFMDVMTVTDDRLKRRTGPGVGRRNNSQTTVVDNTTIDDNFSGHNSNINNNNDVINPPLSTANKPSLLWKKRRKRSSRSSLSFTSVQSSTKVFISQHFRGLSIFLLAIIVIVVIESLNNSVVISRRSPPWAENSSLRKQQQQRHQAAAATAEIMTDFHISFQNNNEAAPASFSKRRRKLIAVSQPATKLFHSNMNEKEMKEYLHHDDILKLGHRSRDRDRDRDESESEYYDERVVVAKPRQIYPNNEYYLLQTDYRDPMLAPDDDDNDAYYAFDDDFVKGTNGIYVETLQNAIPGQVCRKTSNHQRNYQNCNTMFETSFVDIKNNLQYIK